MENKERIQGSGNVSKSSLLQQVRGSMVNIEKLTPDNIGKVADEELSYERAREIFEAEGVDIDKVIVDPTRVIYNVYYADYENGIYFDVHLTEHLLLDKRGGIAALKAMTAKNDALKKRDWHTFYLRDVPCPLKIYDFQRRYKNIEPDQVYGVWEEIHKNLDYENGQWKDEVLDYVFAHAPKPENLPLNENGRVTVYRGSGTLSQKPERALSWSSSQHSALWFANHNGMGQALYTGEVDPDDVVEFLSGFHNENEIIVRRGKVKNIRPLDMYPVQDDIVLHLFSTAFPELMKYGPQVEKFGYPADGIFEYHGLSHILRVLALSLIYFYNSGDDLTERDKNILIYFALLHDIGRTDDEADHRHGKVSVERIEREGIEIDGLAINRKDRRIAQAIIQYHSRPDEDGYAAFAAHRKKYSADEYARLLKLYAICKDMDGLDRVRFNGLDIFMLRTAYAKKLPLIAGCLLHENIVNVVFYPPKE